PNASAAFCRHIRQTRAWHTRCPPYSRKRAGSPTVRTVAADPMRWRIGCVDSPEDSPSEERQPFLFLQYHRLPDRAVLGLNSKNHSNRRRPGEPEYTDPHTRECARGAAFGEKAWPAPVLQFLFPGPRGVRIPVS